MVLLISSCLIVMACFYPFHPVLLYRGIVVFEDQEYYVKIYSREETVGKLNHKEVRINGQNYPLAYLLGHREFWSLDLKVTEDTLIPRPDTETLVEEALAEEFKSALDLGTGTGAIILSLKKERPYAHCVAVELNPRTLEIAKENALLNKLHVDFRLGFWFEPLEKGEIFDLIVSNPPYIEENDPHLRQNGLNFEPQGALVSGPQGLDDLKIIIANAPKFLKKGGRLLVEHGFNQGAAVRELFFKASFSEVKTICDLGGNERVTCGRYL